MYNTAGDGGVNFCKKFKATELQVFVLVRVTISKSGLQVKM